MHTIVNGITLAYSDTGTGLPIIFLHAFPLNRTMWAEQEAALSSQFRVITIDLRGHGESDAPLWHYSLNQAADDVRALLDHLSIAQALFVGLSMGGYILLAFYRKYAVLVKGMVLADTKAQDDTLEGKAALPDGPNRLQAGAIRHCGHYDPEVLESRDDSVET